MGNQVLTGIKAGVSVGVAGVAALLGGWDWPLRALVLLVIMDYISGVMQAAPERKLNSRIGLRGILKKCYYFLMIGAVYALEQALLPEMRLAHEALTIFLAINELISIVEHGRVLGVTVPKFLADLLARLRKEYGEQAQAGDGDGSA